jgi:hypothetical protein
LSGRSPGGGDLELQQARGGTLLKLRVKAGARRDALLGAHGGALKLSVTAPAERGRANRAVLGLLGRALGLPPSSLTLLSGQASPDKTLLVPLPPAELRARLRA